MEHTKQPVSQQGEAAQIFRKYVSREGCHDVMYDDLGIIHLFASNLSYLVFIPVLRRLSAYMIEHLEKLNLQGWVQVVLVHRLVVQR